MAVNKRKVLDAARKYAQKGAKEKALKEYHTLLKLDPRDAKLHLEIGDCYRRWGQIDEAVTQYARVAEQYKGDGFDARAVAVFKQILNLDPKRYTAYVSLADLYQRMGLDAEALGALQSAADGYHKEGQKREALDLLRKMATLDPTNTTSRLKVAELLRQEGMQQDALAEYEAVAAEFSRQGATESFLSVEEKILELQPDREDVLVAIARGLMELRRPERAEPFARRALDKSPESAEIGEILWQVYKALGNEDELTEITRHLAQVYRARGDEDKAREYTQRLPRAFQLDAPAPPRHIEQTESAFLGDDEILEEDFLASDRSERVEPSLDPAPTSAREEPEELELDYGSDELLLDLEQAPAVLREQAPVERPSPQGDPDQLLAEASVYLRYGKRDQAIASLKAVLDQEPEHRAALAKLGDANAEGDHGAEAVAYWSRAARLAQFDGDVETFDVLRDRIGAIDPAAALDLRGEEPIDVEADGRLEMPALETTIRASTAEVTQPVYFEDESAVQGGRGASSSESSSVDEDDTSEFEIDVSFDEELSPSEAASDRGPETVVADAVDAGGDEAISFDLAGLDLDALVESEDREPQSVADSLVEPELRFEEPPVPATEHDAAGLPSSDPDDDTLAEADHASVEIAGDAVEEVAVPGAVAAAPIAAPAPDRFSEDLEEAEFYYQQQLFDEAEAIYRRILKSAPSHPPALMRLGELVVARGDHAARAGERASAGPAFVFETAAAVQDDEGTSRGRGGESFHETEDDTEDDTEDNTEVTEMSPDLDQGVAAMQFEPARSPQLEPLGPASGPGRASLDETTLEFPTPGLSSAGSDVEAAPRADVGVDARVLAVGDALRDEAEPLAAAAEEGGGGLFDLAAELRDVIDEVQAESGGGVASLAVAPPSTVEDGFASIFADFKQGVSATLSGDDYETRYDLGIAYREMELYADAIGEFQRCLASPIRKINSLHMMGLCALDLGQAADAANHFEQALSSPELEDDHRAGLQFDLGRAYEKSGDLGRASSAYQAALDGDPDFPDAAERLARLGTRDPGEPLELDDDGDRFESFDDLMADGNEEEDATPAEAFESFDDVLTAADASFDDAESEDAEEANVDPAPTTAPEDSQSKPRRRKKISFV